jgi:transcriptional regulator with XRE-family HTH domain
MNYEKIGRFISEKRKEKGLTQKELALKIGVTDKAVSKWERGMGCPDVSILEILADCLGVSILEILKGRIIENEIIPITEANDYVKETVKYSKENNKNKIKEIISKIIMFLIIFISTLLIVLNIIHIIYLNYEEEYNFNLNNTQSIKNSVEEIEMNIATIKNNQGIYSDEDYKEITDCLDEGIEQIKNMPIFKYEGTKKIKLNDLFIMDYYYSRTLNIISVYKKLINYDSSIEDYVNLYIDTLVMRTYNNSNIDDAIYKMSHYHIIDIYDNLYYTTPEMYRIQSRMADYNYMIKSYLYFTKMIIEVGDINE